MPADTMTTLDVAERLGVARRTLAGMVAAGRVRPLAYGRRGVHVFDMADVDRLAAERARRRAARQRAAEAGEPAPRILAPAGMLTAREAAGELGVTVGRVYQLARAGALQPASRRPLLFDAADVADLQAARLAR